MAGQALKRSWAWPSIERQALGAVMTYAVQPYAGRFRCLSFPFAGGANGGVNFQPAEKIVENQR
jgi:hypothetical protein